MNTTKTAAELIAIQTAKLDRMKEKAAIEALKDSPILDALMVEFDDATKAEVHHGKGFSTSKQSFANRRESHELWLEEISAAENFAALALEEAKARKSYLRAQLTDISNQDDGVTEEQVNEVLSGLPVCEEASSAKDFLDYCQNRRKCFNLEKAMPKRKSKTESAE